jgi:hypothetical protein
MVDAMKITCPEDAQHDAFVLAVVVHVTVDRYNNITDGMDDLTALVQDKVVASIVAGARYTCMVCGERGKVES